MKKGQITVFVIIGIILIVAIGLIIFAQRERFIEPVEAERIRQAEVPQTVQPIQNFVQDCLYTVSRQGLEILGARGGYINPRQRYNPVEPTAGAAVQFAPESELKIPYWWHMSDDNKCHFDCKFESEQPPLSGGSQSVEGQLDTYIRRNLPDCLNEFKAFKEQKFTVTATGEPKPTTEITQRNIVVLLEYPLEITRDGERFSIKDFVTDLPVKFNDIYVLATNVTNLQATHGFLERATRALIDVFGRLDPEALPPVSAMEIDFGGGTIWTQYEVTEKIRQMLASYIPLLKVTHTDNYRYVITPTGKDRQMYEVLYNRGFVVPVLKPNKNLQVKFTYLPWWKPYIDLNCNGQLCQADGFSSTFASLMIGIQRYHFAYDASYPVLVEVTEPDAFGGEGYTLRYFLEVNMRNNEPLVVMSPPLEAVRLGSRSMFCDPKQRTGGEVTVNVETSTGKPVDGAEVLYRCGEESCSIGQSVNGKIVAKFPRCFGGLVSADHREYAAAVEPLNVIDESEKEATLVMGTPYEVDFQVKKWLLKKQTATFGGISGSQERYIQSWELDTSRPVNQGPYETTTIVLERKGGEFEEPITVFSEVCGSPVFKAPIPCGNPPDDASKNVRIYPGDYHVTIYSFYYPQPALVIPPDARRVKAGSKKRTYWVPPEPIEFGAAPDQSPLYSGFAEFDWTVGDVGLRSAKAIEFYYINFALDKVRPASGRKIEDLEVMGNLARYSAQHQSLLEPKVIT